MIAIYENISKEISRWNKSFIINFICILSKNSCLLILLAPPDKDEVFATLKDANHGAAPGTDGITSLVYKLCWDSMGDALTAVAEAKFDGEKLPNSMRTAMMVFGTKPKKANSLKPGDKSTSVF